MLERQAARPVVIRKELHRHIGFPIQRFNALTIQRGEAACQTNLLMAKFCPDEVRSDFLCDVRFRLALRCFGSNACTKVSQIR